MSLDIDLVTDEDTVFSANITHNMTEMADEAGIYGCLWRPAENNIETAADLAKILGPGLLWMMTHPKECEELDPENGWGSYCDFIPWLAVLLVACSRHPDALVEVDV